MSDDKSEPSLHPAVQPTLAADSLSDLPVSSALTPQTLIAGRYEVLGLLGAGGMGTVYRARDAELEDVVALKVLRRELVDSPGMLDRFRREVKLARRVTHKNVARAFDIGEHKGEKFLTMEYVEGESLSVLVSRERRLPIARVITIATAICEGLSAAHDAGVVHRDLKPDNVMVAKDGRVVITDFGIARAFEPGAASRTQGIPVGTPAYMSPEQVSGSDSIDARSDLYAMGVMLFELFTGQPAWKGDSPYAVAAARLVLPPTDPRTVSSRVSPAAADVILRCMAREPKDRFASARQLADALAQIPTDESPSSTLGASSFLPSHTTPAARPTTQLGVKTVAVLPFANGGAAEDDYLAAGLTEDLIDLLSMTDGLRVRPRGVVAHLAASTSDVRALGRELDVQVVVEGSVRKMGDKIRISTRVLSVADGFQLWAKRFDRAVADLFAVSDEVAKAVADALTVEHVQKERNAPTDPAALDAFLRARHEFHKFDPPSVMRSIELFDHALSLAPNDPQILSGAALARVRLWFFGGEGSAEQATRIAEKAVSVAPDHAGALIALAGVRFQSGEVVDAVRLARRALVIAPALADAHELLGRILCETGPPDLAIQSMTTANRLDPGFEQANWAIARVRALLGSFDDAIHLMRQAAPTSVGGRWIQLARLVFWQQNRTLAAELLANAPDLATHSPLANLILHQLLQPTEGADPLQSFPLAVNVERASWRGRAFMAQARVEFAVGQHHREEAVLALAASVEAGLIDHLWLELCPILEGLRADPRVQPLRAIVKERADRVKAALS